MLMDCEGDELCVGFSVLVCVCVRLSDWDGVSVELGVCDQVGLADCVCDEDWDWDALRVCVWLTVCVKVDVWL